MSDKKNHSDRDEKLHIDKSIFQMSSEAKSEEQRKIEEERRKIAEEKQKKAEEARDKRLEQERLELIRLKQGIIEESETIHEEHEEIPKQSLWKKIVNFFYHNKWWLGIGTFVTAVFIWLTVGYITKPRPDIVILVIGENYALGSESTLADYIEQFTPDNNENGEILASVYYIPYTGQEQRDYANGVPTKLTAELQSADNVIVFCNKTADEIFDSDVLLTDLTTLYPDNEFVNKERFMLSETDFAEKIGLQKDQITDDWFIAIRNPIKLLYDDKDDMQERYDRDFPVFDAIIKDLSK